MDKLIKSRDSVKSKLNNFKTFVDSIKDLETIPVAELHTRIDRVEKLIDSFESIQDEIDYLVELF